MIIVLFVYLFYLFIVHSDAKSTGHSHQGHKRY